jgi:hypothetical protein
MVIYFQFFFLLINIFNAGKQINMRQCSVLSKLTESFQQKRQHIFLCVCVCVCICFDFVCIYFIEIITIQRKWKKKHSEYFRLEK